MRERGRIWRITKKDSKNWQPDKKETITPSVPSLDDLDDPSPITQRRAATWFQNHPQLEALSKLVALSGKTPQRDTHLHHVLKMAIREHLKLPRAFDELTGEPNSDIATIARSVASADASSYLIRYLKSSTKLPLQERLPIFSHIAQPRSC